jgi:alanine dehydrogenase
MKKWIIGCMAFVFCLFWSGAYTIANAGSMAASDARIAKKFQGEVTAIDLKLQTISVKQREFVLTAAFDDKTTVRIEKETKTISDVKIGQKVIIRYFEVDGRNVIKSITIKP